MEQSTLAGPKQRAWMAAGYGFFLDESLIFPIVFAPDDETPLAAIPAFARGECLEMMFGWCMADLRQQRCGEDSLVRSLTRLAAPLASALVAATLALGLNYADGLNALEAMLRHLVRLVG